MMQDDIGVFSDGLLILLRFFTPGDRLVSVPLKLLLTKPTKPLLEIKRRAPDLSDTRLKIFANIFL